MSKGVILPMTDGQALKSAGLTLTSRVERIALLCLLSRKWDNR